jgi:Fe-S-cluster containining protein
MTLTPERAIVPCNGCKACCKKQRVVLREGDRKDFYQTVPNRKGNDGPLELMLAHKTNGDCWYLGRYGCSIWKDAPLACKEFDCRKWWQTFSLEERKAILGDVDAEVAMAAASLLVKEKCSP